MNITSSEKTELLDILCTLVNYGAIGKVVNNEKLNRYRDIYKKLCREWKSVPYLKLDPRTGQGDET